MRQSLRRCSKTRVKLAGEGSIQAVAYRSAGNNVRSRSSMAASEEVGAVFIRVCLRCVHEAILRIPGVMSTHFVPHKSAAGPQYVLFLRIGMPVRPGKTCRRELAAAMPS